MASNNPYLQDMADDIGRRSNVALQQGFQGIRSNSVMGGGLGGSRQGVAEGAAISNSADTLQGNLANMYNTDYQAGENRNVQRYGIDSQAASSRYSADQSLAGSMYGADTSRGIATMNNTTTMRGQDQNYNLGMGQNEISRQNATTNATSVGNQYELGKVQNENTATGLKNNYEIGTNRNNIDQANNVGNLSLNRDRLGLDTTRVGNEYDLGLRNNDFNYTRLASDDDQRGFNNKVTAIGVGNSVQDRLDAGNVRGVTASTAMQNTPIDYYKTFSNVANSLGQGYGTDQSTASTQGNPYVSAAGGAVLGSNVVKNLGFRDTPPVVDDGYSSGTGSSYAINGSNRRGM